jgi:hypothetical protein
MGIFCVSAPAIKPIFRRFAPHLLSSYGYSDSKNPYNGSTRPSDTATSETRPSRKMWHKNRGVIELDDGPRGESFVKRSALQSHSSSEFWTRDIESDARSSDGVLPFFGSLEKGKNVVYKHTTFTVVETRDRRQSAAGPLVVNDKSSIESGEDLSNKSVLKFSSGRK